MCICEAIGNQKSQKSTFIHTQSTFRCFDAVNFRPTAANTEISRSLSVHRYPTHILSHNHYLPMCICEAIGGQTSQNSTFIHTQSTFRCWYPVNFRPTAANIEISRSQVHTGTPHPFCHTTTTFSDCALCKNSGIIQGRTVRTESRAAAKRTSSDMKCCCAAGSRDLDVTINSRETVPLLPVEACL
jgi:hypothetical protein